MNHAIVSIDDLEDLRKFLAIHRLEIGGVESLWNSLKNPIRVKKGRFFNEDDSLPVKKGSKHKQITQILHVWDGENTRYALWNDKTIEICNPDNIRYSYLEKGNHQYDGTILLFKELTEDVVDKIKKYWEKAIGNYKRNCFYQYQFGSKDALTLDEFNCLIKKYLLDKGSDTPPLDPRAVEKGISLLRNCIKNSNLDIRIDDEFIEIGDLRYGIEGKKLRDYLRFEFFSDDSELGCISGIEGILKEGFYNGIIFIEQGVYNIWLGNFGINFKKISGKNSKIYFEGIEIDENDLKFALSETEKFKTKGEYLEFIEKLQNEPRYCSSLIQKGLNFSVWVGCEEEIIINIPVRRKGKKFYFQIGKDEFLIGDIEKISHLKGYAKRIEAFDFYKMIAKNVPVEILEDLIEKSRVRTREIKEKSMSLLEETLKKYADKIKYGKFHVGGKEAEGFVVKGNLKNYFLKKKGLGICTFPKGNYVCIVDDEEQDHLCETDRLISRIYVLMNDDKLKDKIETLDEINFGGGFDEIEDIGPEWTY